MLFSIHPIKRTIQESRYNRLRNELALEQKTILERNDSLHSVRANITQDLSFKGVKLGVYFDTAKGIVDNLDDFQKSWNSPSAYEITITNPNDISSAFIEANKRDIEHTVLSDSVNLPANKYIGMFYSGTTKLDNNQVYVRIFENQDLVVAIVIQESEYSYNSFTDFDGLLSLYTTKYGDPEIERDSTYVNRREYSPYSTNGDKYSWHFKNGVIRLTHKNITYISSGFINRVTDNFENERLRIENARRRYNDSIRVVQLRLDSLKRVEEIADSVRRVRNHQNAINEI